MTTKTQLKQADYDKAVQVLLDYSDGVPPMGNLTPNQLVDQLGYVSVLEKDLEKTKNILWNRLSALQGGGHPKDSKGTSIPDPAVGDVFKYSFEESDRTALDQGIAKDILSAIGRLGEALKTTTSRAKKVRRMTDADKALFKVS